MERKYFFYFRITKIAISFLKKHLIIEAITLLLNTLKAKSICDVPRENDDTNRVLSYPENTVTRALYLLIALNYLLNFEMYHNTGTELILCVNFCEFLQL